MKKIIAVMLSIILIGALCAMPAFAQDDILISDFTGDSTGVEGSVSEAPTGAIIGDNSDETTSHTVTASPTDIADAPPTGAIPEAPTGELPGGTSDFTLDELHDMAAQIEAMTASETWITGIKINEEQRMIVIGTEENTDPLKEKALAQALSEKYGNDVVGALVFTSGDPNEELLTDTGLAGVGADDTSDAWLYAVLCGVALLIFCAVIFAVQRNRQLACQTENGVVCHGENLSRRQVIDSVQKSGFTPKDKTFSEICDRIEDAK